MKTLVMSVSIPNRDFSIFQRCAIASNLSNPFSPGVSIPNRDFSIFQQQRAESLTVFSFQCSVAPTSNQYSISATGCARPHLAKSLKPINSKAFRSCAYLIWALRGCIHYRIKDSAPNFQLSGKTPTAGRN